MSLATEKQHIYDLLPKKVREDQAKILIEKLSKYCTHTINKFKVFNFKDYSEVVNTETLFIKVFETEMQAIDYCLDFYKDSKIAEQSSLF